MPSIIKQAGNFQFSESVKIPGFSLKDGIPQENQDEEKVLETDENIEIEEVPLEEQAEVFELEFQIDEKEELQIIDETIEICDEKFETENQEVQEIQPLDIETVKRELTKAQLLEIFHDEIEEVKIFAGKNAYKTAYEQAYNETVFKRRGEIQDCIKRVDDGLAQIQNFHTRFLQTYSTELKYLAVDIAEKMILHKIQEDELILEKLVKKTVTDIKNTVWFDIEVSDKLVVLVDKLRKDLERDVPNTRITITPKAIPVDSCRVNSEEGTVVSTVSTQAENLKTVFKKNEN